MLKTQPRRKDEEEMAFLLGFLGLLGLATGVIPSEAPAWVFTILTLGLLISAIAALIALGHLLWVVVDLLATILAAILMQIGYGGRRPEIRTESIMVMPRPFRQRQLPRPAPRQIRTVVLPQIGHQR